jgi:hypothetical protein
VLTAADLVPYQEALGDLTEEALGDLRALLDGLDPANPTLYRDVLLEALPELILPYTEASGLLAAEWYDQLRELANPPGRWEPIYAPPPEQGRLDALARWSVGPLFGESAATPETRLVGGAQRLVADASRRTIALTANGDPYCVSYRRVARPKCCTFCGLMASRGAVYTNEYQAGVVIGRGVDPSATAGRRGGQGKGVFARGSQSIGDYFHDDCHCVVVPVHVGQSFQENAVQKRFDDAYVEAGDSRSLTASLTGMRRELGTR